MSEPASGFTTQRSQEKKESSSDPTTLNSRAKHVPTTSPATSLASVTAGRSEMGEEESQLSSKPRKSADVAENGSITTSKEQPSTSETAGSKPVVGGDASQLCKWVYETSHDDLTVAENLEKSKWEGGSCQDAEKSGK